MEQQLSNESAVQVDGTAHHLLASQMSPLADSMAQVTLNNSQSAKAIDISSLPFELLDDTLRWLDVRSLKIARLTCRRWGEAGANSLFRRIYFAPRADVMKEFTEITNKPAFATKITEVVYDARMFWTHAATRPEYYKAFHRGFPDRCEENELSDDETDESEFDDSDFEDWCEQTGRQPFREKLADSHQRYASLLKEQTSIIGSGQDLVALCEGMKRLPNIEWISILDDFGHTDYSPFLWVSYEWRWYHRRSDKSMEGVAKPARWLSAQYSRNVLGDHHWDLKGIENLFQAVLLHASKLKKLVIGSQLSNLSAEILSKPAAIGAMSTIAPQLTLIKLDCSPPRGNPSRQWIEDLAGILRQATQLKELYLTLCRPLINAQKIFQDRKWPHLKILDLGDGEVDLDILKAISHSHADVLRELRLRNSFLLGPEKWEDAAVELGKILKLDFVALSSMCDTVSIHEPYDDPKRVHVIARRFMQRNTNSDLGMVGSGGFVVAWHKQNYKQTSGFVQICGACDEIEVNNIQL